MVVSSESASPKGNGDAPLDKQGAILALDQLEIKDRAPDDLNVGNEEGARAAQPLQEESKEKMSWCARAAEGPEQERYRMDRGYHEYNAEP